MVCQQRINRVGLEAKKKNLGGKVWHLTPRHLPSQTSSLYDLYLSVYLKTTAYTPLSCIFATCPKSEYVSKSLKVMRAIFEA